MQELLELLKKKIVILRQKTNGEYNLNDEIIEHLYSVYPFNKFEYIISHLIAKNIITLDQYIQIRSEYMERNKYLFVFEITAPRDFGEKWAQQHLNQIVPELRIPNKQLDPYYEGQYDFWYNDIKIEVKASRAVKKKSKETLVEKALSSKSTCAFDMNFQQLKPSCCDVFVWIGVWRDIIRYWVLSSEDVLENPYFSHGQHRGNQGEGQLWIKNTNINDFCDYEVCMRDVFNAIINKGVRR